MNYFAECTSIEEAKKLWKQLAIKHHPDKEGGNNAVMQEINVQYVEFCKNINKQNCIDDETSNKEIIESLLELLKSNAQRFGFGLGTAIAVEIFKQSKSYEKMLKNKEMGNILKTVQEIFNF